MTNQGKDLHEKFLEILKRRVPERGKLANLLINSLFIEREAAYRRIRGEVPFTFAEVAAIAKELHISIDEMFGITSEYKSTSFRMYGYNFFNMTEADYAISRQLISIIRTALDSPYSEFGFAVSIVPLHFSTYFTHIFRLYMLRQMYPFGSPGIRIPYAEVRIPEKLQKYHDEFLEEIQKINHTYFIWDDLLMLYIANDVKYFNRIQLISDDEVVEIKEELAQFLDELEKLAFRGCYNMGNEVEIYVSNLNFDATYTYLYSEKVNFSMLTTFSLSAATSLEKTACDNMRTWIQSLKRTSTLISKCAEVDRRMFFKKQREYLDSI